ncbi:Metaxin-2 [Umbelopsis nana]
MSRPQLPALPTIELPAFLEPFKLKKLPLKTFPATYEPSRPDKPALHIFGPGWEANHTSFDVDCLAMQIYLKFCGVDFDVVLSNEPYSSPKGKLPYLVVPPDHCLYGEQIHHWLEKTEKQKKLSNEAESSEAKAFIAMVEKMLGAALMFSLWLEPLNANELTCPKYFAQVSSPIDKLLAYRKKEEVVQSLLIDRDVLIREEIYQAAAEALSALSVKLGSKEHYFGSEHPTYVDAIAFAYFHIILAIPQITDSNISKEEKRHATELRNLLLHHSNLVKYTKKMYSTWLKQ